ncbi:MAG: RDD family protein [Planctomycetota bacterium]
MKRRRANPIHAPVRLVREVTTPEGVRLPFTLASLGDRGGAFILDGLLIVLATILLGIVCLWSYQYVRGWALAIFFVASFLFRSLYFIAGEASARRATLGKRKLGLRVIDRNGGQLTLQAVIARNLMREVEIIVPLVAVFSPEAIFGQWVLMLLALLVLVPVFNRDRLRVGDLIAGTLVVRSPEPVLLEDLTHESARKSRGSRGASYTFSPKQLSMYGIKELQVLEELLRNPKRERGALELVCDKVKKKIAWPRSDWDVRPERFLRDFYAAQRAHLEQKMLFGERVEEKKRGRLGGR